MSWPEGENGWPLCSLLGLLATSLVTEKFIQRDQYDTPNCFLLMTLMAAD